MDEILKIDLTKKQISFVLQALNAISVQGIESQRELLKIVDILESIIVEKNNV